MVGYPASMSDLMSRFFNEQSCKEYLAKLKWPKGFVCPKCSGNKHWETKRDLKICSQCQYQQSLFAGTIFQGSRMPLKIWFQAIWWITSQKNGASTLRLQRALGLNRYETAWWMSHKLRVAMVRPYRDQLSGEVEVDEAYFGGVGNKHLVGVAAEVRGSRTGRIRMQKIKDRSGPILQSFVERHIAPDSTIVTDGLKSYCGVEEKGYRHKPLRKPYFWEDQNPEDDRLLPRVHRVISLAKRWVLGTYQGSMDKKYFDAYLNEFTFCFNRRASKSRGLLFQRLLENAIAVEPVSQGKLKSNHNI